MFVDFFTLFEAVDAWGELTPSLLHWRECKLKPTPIFVLVD
jgi:hypothetical protein